MKNERYSKVAGAGGTIRSLTCKAELMLKKKTKQKKKKKWNETHFMGISSHRRILPKTQKKVLKGNHFQSILFLFITLPR